MMSASLLFQVIAERYQRRQPIILTSNKAFAGWGQGFAAAAIMAFDLPPSTGPGTRMTVSPLTRPEKRAHP